MPELTIQQAFNLAMQYHQAGRLPEAEKLYRQILIQQPDHADALHLLGVIALQMGRNDVAIDLIREAIALNPKFPVACNNLGTALKNAGQLDDAIAAHRQAILLNPNWSDPHNNLGIALASNGQFDQAIASYRQAIALNPNDAVAYCNLGNALKNTGQLDEAIAAYQRSIAVDPRMSEAHNNLGTALRDKGQLDQSIAAHRQAIALKPNNSQAHNNLGNAFRAKGQLEQAITAYRQAITLAPNYALAYSNLGNGLKDLARFDEAADAYRKAISLSPKLAEAHHNLGTVLWGNGLIHEAITAYRAAIAINPNFVDAHSNLVYSMHFHSAYDVKEIAEEHRRWSQQHADPIRRMSNPTHDNDPNPDRRLKVGYVSPDFREHPVGRFMLPLLQYHDESKFEIYCYSNATQPDAFTARLQSHSNHWREIAGLSDDQLAVQIRADGIDILVDLSGHTAGNRLLAFVRKPAPVQVNYLGYPDTTGLPEIDCTLTDAIADPPGQNDRDQTLYRLPQTNWCFPEIENSPAVQPPPSSTRGCITFGSFNNFAKVTDEMLHTWLTILKQIPNSRLMLKSASFGAASVRQRLKNVFLTQGVDINRLILHGTKPDYASHLTLYNEMDIALDTFPYHGTTTTCDALWMGVPVITPAGKAHVSRVGVSLLGNMDLSEFVATTTEDYIRLAIALAGDQDRLMSLRVSLRQRMQKSPLMDGRNFARNVERAYREFWHAWCQRWK